MKKIMKKLVKKIKGFTLVELMIAISIGVIVVTLGVVSINNFYDKQKIDGATADVAGMVRLAKNYAVTMQSPGGYTGTVEYVALLISDTGLITVVPGSNVGGLSVGTSYVSKQLETGSLMVTRVDPGLLMFSMPEGKLVQFVDTTLTAVVPRGSTESVNIIIRSKQDPEQENGILIESNGLIDETANTLGQVPEEALVGPWPGEPALAEQDNLNCVWCGSNCVVFSSLMKCFDELNIGKECIERDGECTIITTAFATATLVPPSPTSAPTPTTVPVVVEPTIASGGGCIGKGICLGCWQLVDGACTCLWPCQTAY